MKLINRYTLGLHAAVALFGLAGLFGRWLDLSPILIVKGRTTFAALAMLILLLAQGKLVKRSASFYLNLILIGAILAFHWLAFFEAIQTTSLALALLSFASFPLFTLVLEWLFGLEKVKKEDLMIVLISLLGTAMILPWDTDSPDFLGVVWGLASGLSFAILTILNRKQVKTVPVLELSFYQNAFAALLVMPLAWQAQFALKGEEWILLVILGLVFTALSHALFINALRFVKARTAALVAALEPVYGIAAGLILFAEYPAILTYFGGALVLGAGLYAQIKD